MPIDAPDLIRELRAHLFDWLPRQAWFDADEGEVGDITVIRTEAIRRQWPLVLWVPLEVEIDGAPVLCQTVLALAPEVPGHVPEAAILGEVPSTTGPVMAYDALADPDATAAFVEHLADGIVRGVVSSVVDEPWLTTIELEQRWEVTLYRRVQAGAHPDIELPSLLAPDGQGLTLSAGGGLAKNQHDLASVRRGVRRGESAVELSRASVAELLDRRCQPRENRLDVIEPMTTLGQSLAALHVSLAEQLGSTDGDGHALLEVLASRLPRQLDDAAASRVAGAYQRLAHADDLGRFIRIHGNLDLASVERSRASWVFTRFGCNPDSDLLTDREPLSPLCDLAGLLHGVGRCAAAALTGALESRAASDDADPDFYEQALCRELVVLAEAWEERSVDAIIAGYTSNDEVHRLLPVERISRDALLTLFELELSVREVVRGAERGADMLRIPIAAVEELSAASVRERW